MRGNRVKLDNEHWCGLLSKLVETSREGKATILSNQGVRTDRTLPNNKPDIIIRDKKRNMHVNRCCNYRGQKLCQERSLEYSKNIQTL
jgi:hypothetical protein